MGMYLFFMQNMGDNASKPRKTAVFQKMCKLCDKMKKLQKGLEKGEKVVYNGFKW